MSASSVGPAAAELNVRPATAGLPPLENGDCLTRDEFERRYAAMPHVKKAELIEGMVHMPSPVRLEQHAAPTAELITWLGTYRAHTPGIRVGDNATVRLDLDNEPQPDAILFVEPAHGGQVKVSDDGYVEGSPEFVAEVAASSVSIDLHAKFHVYRRSHVCEYLVWRVQDKAIDWFVLREGEYQLLTPDPDGVIESAIFRGLQLHVEALIRGDLAGVLEVLHEGLGSSAHAEFVQRMEAAAGRSGKGTASS